MTMPDERTRALRFGWEFLLELRDEPNLTDEQRGTVAEILRHYPCAAEIKAWAKDCEQTRDPLFGAQMAPEEPQSSPNLAISIKKASALNSEETTGMNCYVIGVSTELVSQIGRARVVVPREHRR